MANIEEKVEKLIKNKIESIGYELYDVLYLKEGKNYTLRIVIDNEKGISLEDCEKVNNEITDILDEAEEGVYIVHIVTTDPIVESDSDEEKAAKLEFDKTFAEKMKMGLRNILES